MKIYKEIETIIKKWNDENKCGYCWDFRASDTDKRLNIHKKTELDVCCAFVGVFDGEIQYNIKDYNVTQIEHTAKMFVGLPSRLDENFYNEDKDIDFDTTKIKDICDLELCLRDFDLCETDLNLTYLKGKLVLNYLDQNYDGFLFTIKATEYI